MKIAALGAAFALTATAQAQQLQAGFYAEESATAYYQQGWDTNEEMLEWKFTGTNGGVTNWGFRKTPQFGSLGQQPDYSTIEPGSVYSLYMGYSQQERDEDAISPEIEVQPGSTVEYYLCLYAVWYYNADLKLYITDVATGTREQLVSTFMWAQENAFTGPNWVKFSSDLSKYAGKKCTFTFNYKGSSGENVYIDGFRLKRHDTSATSTVNIFEGGQVHFTDATSGNPTAWQWTFDGGTPATSTDQNPVVTYSKAGTYSVSLKATGDGATSTAERKGYIIVKAQAPKALIGIPAGAYLSPWAYAYVPTNTPVQFADLSSGQPTSWLWSFEGASPATSADQNPTVTYGKEGVYGLTLSVSNSAGSSDDFLKNAIQAGGSQYVWNIEPEEIDLLGEISLGLYGMYAGTNWLGITKYAEHFSKPLAPAEIDSVQIFFHSVKCSDANQLITVSICAEGAGGMPGKVLAQSSVKAGDLAYDEKNIVPTNFKLDQKVTVNEPFFVVVEGMTNNDGDEMSIYCVLRKEGKKSSTFHELEDEDENGNLLGTFQWFENIDSPVSMAVTPRLTYLGGGITSGNNYTYTAYRKPYVKAIYDIGGWQRPTISKGLNIVLFNDGSVEKVIGKENGEIEEIEGE